MTDFWSGRTSMPVMNTSPFIHSALGSCCQPSGEMLWRAAKQQTKSLEEFADGRSVNPAVRIRDQVVFWMLGVLGIGTGCILWKMDFEGQWLVRGVSLASVAGGLLFWGVLMHWLWTLERSARPSVASKQNGFWFYSGGATHLGPVIGIMKQLADEVQARSVILLESQVAGWRFKAGYQTSPGLGRAVAHALHHRVPRDGQMACVIEVLDAAVMAFCTPMSTLCGRRDFVLVVLFEEAPLRFHGSIAPAARRSVERIRETLEAVEKGSVSGHLGRSVAGGAPQRLLPVCCSVCDQVRLMNRDVEHWTHWSQWLQQHHGLPLTHTICPTCAGWLYDVSAHPEADAKTHHHAA